jgi:hypothetical protein
MRKHYKLTQAALALFLTALAMAIIRYTSPSGAAFSEWIMYPQPPG